MSSGVPTSPVPGSSTVASIVDTYHWFLTRPIDAPSWFEEAGASFVAGMPAHFERLTWSAERLRDHQEQQLRRLLAAAVSGSAFHRRRLSGVNADSFTLDDLAGLPVMTKSEMMSCFDEVVTDPRLRRDAVEAHVRTAGAEPVTLDGRFLPLASGGSSGERGIFVYDQEATVTYLSAFVRTGMARFAARVGWPPPMRVSIAIVGAPAAIHATSAIPHLMRAFADVTFAPATLPFDEIVDRVAAARPVMLAGYPSMIAELADAQAAGRLSIEPLTISPSSEQLTKDLASRITEGFGVAPSSGFGTSEGCQGYAPAGSDEFTFASDCAIMEFVDEREHPVPFGTPADHVLITNLFNPLQPLIRYRLDDRMTPLPAAPDHGHQRARLVGRTDSVVTIGGTTVHTVGIASALLRHPEIREHQTVIGSAGLTIRILCEGPVDLALAAADIAASLAAAGASTPVEVVAVDALDRDPLTGKVRRILVN
jgi:phenylacetate-CoA ligase